MRNETQRPQATQPRTHSQKAVEMGLDIATFMKFNPQLCPKRYRSACRAVGDVTADRILQHPGISQCHTVPTVPRVPAMEGEAEAQAASTAQDLHAGAGQLGGQGGWDRLGPPRAYLEFEPGGRTRKRV